MSINAGDSKSKLLGMSFGAANSKLKKMIIFNLLTKEGKNICYRCGDVITTVDELSVEHKLPWKQASDPIVSFFDINNIAFSHLRCNCGASNVAKQYCPKGHPYDEENTYIFHGSRRCITCHRQHNREAGERRNKKRKTDVVYGDHVRAINRAWYAKRYGKGT